MTGRIGTMFCPGLVREGETHEGLSENTGRRHSSGEAF